MVDVDPKDQSCYLTLQKISGSLWLDHDFKNIGNRNILALTKMTKNLEQF